MKYLLILSLLFVSCIPSLQEVPDNTCVVYNGYNQRWFKSVKELKDGTLEVVDSEGTKSIISDYSSYSCKE